MAEIWAAVSGFAARHSAVIAMVGAAAGVIAMTFAGLALRHRRGLTKAEVLKDPNSYPALLAALNPGPAQAYLTRLTWISGHVDRLYGPRLLSWRAFDRALLIAFLYPVFALIAGWLIFDAGHLGGAEFLPQGQAWGRRALAIAGVGLGSIFSFIIFKYKYKIRAIFSKTIVLANSFRGNPLGFFGQASRLTLTVLPPIMWSATVFVVNAIIWAFAFLSSDAATGAFVIAFAFSFIGAAPSASALAAKFTGAITVTGAVTAAMVSTVVFALAGPGRFVPSASKHLLILLFFLTLLPLLNAAADFLSVAATRWFLRKITAVSARAGLAAILFGLAVDVIIAILCLAGLLAALTQSLVLWAAIHPATLPLDWRLWLGQICAGDTGRGTMLWLMLITTLIPTALHLAAGLGAVITRNAHIDGQIRAILAPDGTPARSALSALQIDRADRLYARREWFGTLVFVALLVIILAGLAALIWAVAPSLGLSACQLAARA